MPLCDSCIFSRIPCPVRDFDIMIDIEVCAYWKDREALVDAVAACLEERILSPTRETCGKCMHRGETAFDEGFAPLVRHWQWINRYRPENPNRITLAKAQADVSTHYQIENGKLRQELEALRAQLAVAKQNVPAPLETAAATLEAAAAEQKDPNEPAVIPEQVAALKKAGKRVAWSGGVAVPQPAPQGVPLPGTGAPGQPSPMVQKAPALPPGVVPGRLVNGPDGKPVWQPGEVK